MIAHRHPKCSQEKRKLLNYKKIRQYISLQYIFAKTGGVGRSGAHGGVAAFATLRVVWQEKLGQRHSNVFRKMDPRCGPCVPHAQSIDKARTRRFVMGLAETFFDE